MDDFKKPSVLKDAPLITSDKTQHEIFDGSAFNVIDPTTIAEQAAAKERAEILEIIRKYADNDYSCESLYLFIKQRGEVGK